MGTFPPNVMPEEILSNHPERLRAALVSAANPLRSYSDTTAYEEAFRALDLLVVMDVAFTETASLAHYVLPASSQFEKWEATFFTWNFLRYSSRCGLRWSILKAKLWKKAKF